MEKLKNAFVLFFSNKSSSASFYFWRETFASCGLTRDFALKDYLFRANKKPSANFVLLIKWVTTTKRCCGKLYFDSEQRIILHPKDELGLARSRMWSSYALDDEVQDVINRRNKLRAAVAGIFIFT
ncbi:hypothetical protein TNCV_1149441 [Trichonephila clavipes]|nr:hypothetical protein TNCV_1149441 [Trichonephila clavipes]